MNIGKRAMLGAIAHIAGIENPTFEGANWILNKDDAQKLIDSGAIEGSSQPLVNRGLNMIEFYETPGDWKSPNWDEIDRVHDWKNYISDKMRAIWDTFNDEQKQAIAESAQGAANSEQWD